MFIIICFTILLVIIFLYVRNVNKVPKEIKYIPHVSGFPAIWAFLKHKPHDEIQEISSKTSKGHENYITQIGQFTSMYNITSPESAKDLLMTPEDVAPKFQFQPGNALHDFFGNGLVFSNGDVWRTYRKLANPAFNSALRPDIVGETTMELFALMEKNLNKSITIDTFATMQRITIEVLGKLAFGYQFGCLKSAETPHIINVYKYLISVVESPIRSVFPWISKLPLESNRKFVNAREEFDKFIFEIIEKKKDELKKNKDNKNSYSGSVDLLTSMLKLSEQEGIHDDIKQLRDEMVTFFVAGHDTTAMALSTSLYFLAKYPEMQEQARSEVINILGNKTIIPTSEQLKEMKYITAVIKESLRIYPPVPVPGIRQPSESIKIGSDIIPKGTLCLVSIWQIHYNLKHWENPKQYNPERFLSGEKRHPFSWIPFSSGPRNCIGQNFSLMEQKIILSMFLLKYNWTLPENSINKEKLILEPQFLLRPVNLELEFTERN